MNYLGVDKIFNKELCRLELALSRLNLTHRQLKLAKQLNLSESIINYLDEKNSEAAEFCLDMFSDIVNDYQELANEHLNAFNTVKTKTWEIFKKYYPECKQSFDQIFGLASITYGPYVADMKKRVENKEVNDLDVAFHNYSKLSVEKLQLDNYYSLLKNINGQFEKFGGEGLMPQQLSDDCVKIPIWPILEIAFTNNEHLESLIKENKQLESAIFILSKKLEKHPDNLNLKHEYNELVNKDKVQKYEISYRQNLEKVIENLGYRSHAISDGLNQTEVEGLFQEKLFEILRGIPKEVRKLEGNRKQMIALKQEVANVINLARNLTDCFEGALVLGKVANQEVKITLTNYEYSKIIVDALRQDLTDNVYYRRELTQKNENPKTKESERVKNTNVINEIIDLEEAYNWLCLETPFGVVKYGINTLTNIHTGQTFPIEKLQDYTLKGEVFYEKTPTGELEPTLTVSEVQAKINSQGKKF